jgi:hypothetical protein
MVKQITARIALEPAFLKNRWANRSARPAPSSRLWNNLVYAKKRPTCSEWRRGLNNHMMLKNAVQQGRSERRGEAYGLVR